MAPIVTIGAMTYSIQDHTLLLDNAGKRYVLKVRDLPPEEKPRERLLIHGPSALTVRELLAIVLGTGTTKEDVLTMSSRILREYGERPIFSASDPKHLSEDLDIPLGKAMQIVATGELGRRFFRKQRNGAPIIRMARDVFEYALDMRNLPKEQLRGLYLDAHYQVLHDEMISIGTVDSNMVHPREVFRPALAHAAVAIVLVHNHPSGITTPSEADIAVTKQLGEVGKILGIDLIDHVIVTQDSFESVPLERSTP